MRDFCMNLLRGRESFMHVLHKDELTQKQLDELNAMGFPENSDLCTDAQRRIIEFVSESDREYFEAHPRARCRVRDALALEFSPAGSSSYKKVLVWRIARGVRARATLTEQQAIDFLRQLPYSEYLETEHWQSVRDRAIKRAKSRCQLCNSGKSINVHHRTYEHRGFEKPQDVIVLCRKCHAKFHDKIP